MRITNKNVDIIKYLPEFMQKYKEIKQITNAENAEFSLIWDKLKQEFENQFIKTCDVDGIILFEKLLSIKNSTDIDLNIRKFNVLSKFGTDLPYTYLNLIEKLNFICGENNYKIELDTDKYIIKINISNLNSTKKKILVNTIQNIIPCNIKLVLSNNEWEITFDLNINLFTGFSEYKSYIIGDI